MVNQTIGKIRKLSVIILCKSFLTWYSVNERSDQQTSGIITFTDTLGVQKFFLASLVFEFQPLFDVAVINKLMDNLFSMNTSSSSSTEVYMED